MKTCIQLVVLAALLTVIFAASVSAEPNLLVNPSFEEGPYGDFVYDGVNPMNPTGWVGCAPWPIYCFNGVYDASWKNHNCNYPVWPDPLHDAVDGTHFLGKYVAPNDPTQTMCDYENFYQFGWGNYGYLRQVVKDLEPGQTYYFSTWFANSNSRGWQTPWGWQFPMFRVGLVPQEFNATSGTFTPPLSPDPDMGTDTPGVIFVPKEVPNPPGSPSNYSRDIFKAFTGSNQQWRKLSGKVTLGPTQNSVTFFLEYFVDSNVGHSEPQMVQVDNCRLAKTAELKVENVEFTGWTSSSATLEWDVTDGFDKVYGLAAADCGVKYGTTSSYGSYVGGTEPNGSVDPVTFGKPGHYKAVISGLAPGQAYHFSIEVKGGMHNYVERYANDGMPPVIGQRNYEQYASSDAAFVQALPITISNVRVENVAADSADVKWTTNVASDSRVDYGLSTTYAKFKTDSAQVTQHVVHIDGLLSNTTYSYKVSSVGSSLNKGTYSSTFTTLLSRQITNGGFEIEPKIMGTPAGWLSVPKWNKDLQSYHIPEWGISPHGGNWYAGTISHYGGDRDKYAIFQQIATNAGEVISLYAWSYADGCGDCSTGTPVAQPHRFGEINNQIGLDPTGAKPSTLVTWPTSTIWSGQLSSMKFQSYINHQCGLNGDWRRIGVCAIAEGTKATLYLRSRSWYGVSWLYNCFDDVQLVAPTAISSVSELKSQPIQTNVNLSGGDYVVTYVCSSNPDITENVGQPYFYIEDADRSAGIKVTVQSRSTWPSWVAVGKKVNIIGTLDWGVFRNPRLYDDHDSTRSADLDQQLRLDKPCGELVLRAAKITDAGSSSVPGPVAVSNQTLGGGSSADPWITNAGVAGGSGANNVGLRVRTWGKVAEINYEQQTGYVYMVIDDGSALPAPATPTSAAPYTSVLQYMQHTPGLFVRLNDSNWPTLADGTTEVQPGDYVMLTGISSVIIDLDTDDINASKIPLGGGDAVNYPEADKNVRTIKIEPYGIEFFRLEN